VKKNSKEDGTMKKRFKKRLKKWAEFRFSIIGGLLANPPDKGQLASEIKALANQSYLHPTKDREVHFGASTIERWYYQAIESDDPVFALGRKIRSDAGSSIAMSPQLLDQLKQQYGLYPSWSYQLHRDNLAALVEQRPELGKAPSYSTVYRRMRERGWIKKASRRNKTKGQQRAAQRLEQREVRGFASEYVHALWHLDFHQAKRRVADALGNWHPVVALCVLDDCSRLCCHIQWYLGETAECLCHGLMQAFQKRGLARALMTDNGSAMRAEETKNGLLRLGIKHEKTLAYSPYQNGKQESFWGQLEGRLMAMLSRVEPLTLDFLNRASLAWAELDYNQRVHEELGDTPLKCMLKGKNVSRPSPDSQTLRFFFGIQQRRCQRKSDGTIRILQVRFEIPSRFRHFEHLYVRYQSWDLSKAYLVDQQSGDLIATIYPQDKAKNAQGYRRPLEPSLASDISEPTDSDPIPALLRKILSNYAATGLPPAYLPKEEVAMKTDTDKEDT